MSKIGTKTLYVTLLIATACVFCSCELPVILPAQAAKKPAVIVSPKKASYAEALAGKEIRRYLYLRTDKLPAIIQCEANSLPETDFIAAMQKDGDIVRRLTESDAGLKNRIDSLGPQQYLIKTTGFKNKKVVLIVGGDSAGVLYGTYRFIERFGVRFYLDGDVIPDEKVAFELPQVDEEGKPLFEIRGIHPFHDFPEGPDWWDVDGYKAIIGQLPKLRMNFFGLHTYPEKGLNCQFGNTEPTVWVGITQDTNPDGTVKFATLSRHFTTMSNAWGYKPTKTSRYNFGAAQIFERDDFGADYMDGMSPWPATAEKRNELFNRFGAVLNDAYRFAHKLEVKTCVGTEAPLSEPNALKQRLRDMGKDPCSAAAVQEVYEGIFSRIVKSYPIDYYWLWTPEHWTWMGAKDTEVEATVADLKIAIAAAEKVESPFTLATCGWVLGPQNNRALFDSVLPKDMPISCINRDVGFAFVEPGFGSVKGRPKWSMPWLEDDPALTIPQLWAGRMRRDAADSLNYGCTGLVGIHWRTRIIRPNISALAQAAWNQDFSAGIVLHEPNSALGETSPFGEQVLRDPNSEPRDLPVGDFYADWAAAQFGEEAAEPLAKLFAGLDGGSFSNIIHQRKTNLPRPATWIDGPGGIKAEEKTWEEMSRKYAFVNEMAKLRSRVKGGGNLERFDYWLNNFRYLREVGELGCIYGRFNKALEKISVQNNPQVRRQTAAKLAMPIRRKMAEKIAEANKYLLATVGTTGEMGNVTNWQNRAVPKLLEESLQKLSELAGEQLAEDVVLSKEYAGEPRVFVPTVRGSLEADEDLRLKVIVLDREEPKDVLLYWGTLGGKKLNKIPVTYVARGVYTVVIPAEDIKGSDFEYYIKVTTAKGQKLYFPGTAPNINQTVVVVERSKE